MSDIVGNLDCGSSHVAAHFLELCNIGVVISVVKTPSSMIHTMTKLLLLFFFVVVFFHMLKQS